MANNKQFSNLLPKNIDNEIPITFQLIAPSKEATETTGRPRRSKSPINDLPTDLSEKFMNHL